MAVDVNLIVTRPNIQIFLNTTGTAEAPVWERCAKGWKKFSENPNAQTESVQYINEASETTDTVSYSPQYGFECDLMPNQPTIKKIYDIAKDRKTGSEAVVDVLVVDTFEQDEKGAYTARRESLAVAVSSLDGTKKMSMSGNLNGQGDGVKGKFTPATSPATGASAGVFVADTTTETTTTTGTETQTEGEETTTTDEGEETTSEGEDETTA